MILLPFYTALLGHNRRSLPLEEIERTKGLKLGVVALAANDNKRVAQSREAPGGKCVHVLVVWVSDQDPEVSVWYDEFHFGCRPSKLNWHPDPCDVRKWYR
jgi:hypothetical protein